MCGIVGLNCLHALKCRWPLQDLSHVLLGIPAIGDVIRLLLCLGHGLLLVLDKAVLWGHLNAEQQTFTLAMAGHWNLKGGLIYMEIDAWNWWQTKGVGWSPSKSCMTQIRGPFSCDHRSSTGHVATAGSVAYPLSSPHKAVSTWLWEHSLPWCVKNDRAPRWLTKHANRHKHQSCFGVKKIGAVYCIYTTVQSAVGVLKIYILYIYRHTLKCTPKMFEMSSDSFLTFLAWSRSSSTEGPSASESLPSSVLAALLASWPVSPSNGLFLERSPPSLESAPPRSCMARPELISPSWNILTMRAVTLADARAQDWHGKEGPPINEKHADNMQLLLTVQHAS